MPSTTQQPTTYILTATATTAEWLTTEGPDDALTGIGTNLGGGLVRLTQDELDQLIEMHEDLDGTVEPTSATTFTLYEDGSGWPVVAEPVLRCNEPIQRDEFMPGPGGSPIGITSTSRVCGDSPAEYVGSGMVRCAYHRQEAAKHSERLGRLDRELEDGA